MDAAKRGGRVDVSKPYKVDTSAYTHMKNAAIDAFEKGNRLKAKRKKSFGDVRASIASNPNLKNEIDSALVLRSSDSPDAVPLARRVEITFSENLPFFDFLGLPNLQVVSNVVHVRKLSSKHGLSSSQIADLPNRYNSPVAVFRDGSSAFTVLTDLLSQNDAGLLKPVMVRLALTTRKNGERLFLASAYARESSSEDEYLRLARTSDSALYIDENKIATLPLEQGTTSTLRSLADRDSVLTASDFSWWSTRSIQASSSRSVNPDSSVRPSLVSSEPSDVTDGGISPQQVQKLVHDVFPDLNFLGRNHAPMNTGDFSKFYPDYNVSRLLAQGDLGAISRDLGEFVFQQQKLDKFFSSDALAELSDLFTEDSKKQKYDYRNTGRGRDYNESRNAFGAYLHHWLCMGMDVQKSVGPDHRAGRPTRQPSEAGRPVAGPYQPWHPSQLWKPPKAWINKSNEPDTRAVRVLFGKSRSPPAGSRPHCIPPGRAHLPKAEHGKA